MKKLLFLSSLLLLFGLGCTPKGKAKKESVPLAHTVNLSDSALNDSISPSNWQAPVPGGVPDKKEVDSLRLKKKKNQP